MRGLRVSAQTLTPALSRERERESERKASLAVASGTPDDK
jgi:hypothetical protein